MYIIQNVHTQIRNKALKKKKKFIKKINKQSLKKKNHTYTKIHMEKTK